MFSQLPTSLPRSLPPSVLRRRVFSNIANYRESPKIGGAALLCVTVVVGGAGLATAVLCKEDRLERWENRWSTGYTAWHRLQPNARLVDHYDRFLAPDKTQKSGDETSHRVLVPLCGKSVDMPYLGERGHDVVGVDCVEAAAWQLQRDAWLKFEVDQVTTPGAGGGKRPDFIAAPTFVEERSGYVFKTGDKGTGYYLDAKVIKWFRDTKRRISFAVHDFFHLTPSDIGTFDRIWDRAALVAIRPEDREEYAATCDSLLKPGGRILLLTLVYNQEKMSGPPFSIPSEEVQRLYGELGYKVETLSSVDSRKDFQGRNWEALQTAGLDEVAFLLTKPAPSSPGWFARVVLRREAQQQQ